jgi:hypothetical protein
MIQDHDAVYRIPLNVLSSQNQQHLLTCKREQRIFLPQVLGGERGGRSWAQTGTTREGSQNLTNSRFPHREH